MNLRVFVQVWCEIDPTLNLRVDRQTGAAVVEGGDVLMRVSPVARFGVTEALNIPDAEMTAFALGDGHDEALLHALASGATRAIVAASVSERMEEPPPKVFGDSKFAHARGYDASDLRLTAPLAQWLADQKPDLVIADCLAGRVAARLGWAHLAGVDQLQIEGGRLKAVRHLGRGAREIVTARLPAVVRMLTESTQVRYISRARIAAVAERPIEQADLRSSPARNETEIGPLQVSRPRTRLGAAPAAAPAKAMDRLNALMGLGRAPAAAASPKASEPTTKTPEQMAEEFVRYLAHHDLLDDV